MPKLELSLTESDSRALRNCLVQYHGGGYEGCFWEYNYAFLDKHGAFHCLLATGRRGLDTMEDLCEHLSEQRGYQTVYTYQLDVPAEAEEFSEETNDGGVILVAEWLHSHWPELDLAGPCTECGEKFPIWSAMHDSYRGNGGIGVVMTGRVCADCVIKLEAEGDTEIYAPVLPTEPMLVRPMTSEVRPHLNRV